MQKLQFSIKINASRERVWNILWENKSFRDWASIIDEGTYMVGNLKEGCEVQFISSVNGYSVTSLVEKLVPNEYVLFRHKADTKESGESKREKDWTGGTESHSLTEEDGVTTWNVEFDVPTELEEIFKVRFPQALERVKILAEKKDESPKVSLNFIILRENKILLGLLTKNWLIKGKQVYGTPGRDLRFRETIGNGVKRDIKEELDVEVISHKVFSVNANYEYGNHYIDIGVIVEIKGEIKLLKPNDWEKWEWFEIGNIPSNLFPSAKNLIDCFLNNKICVVE